jgi:hypothetical protein
MSDPIQHMVDPDAPWLNRERCLLDGLIVLATLMGDRNRDPTPCARCNHDREKCGGLPRDEQLIELYRPRRDA